MRRRDRGREVSRKANTSSGIKEHREKGIGEEKNAITEQVMIRGEK